MPTITHQQKLISFPLPLYQKASQKLNNYGISFSEYVRMLIIQDLAKAEIVPDLDEETSLKVQQGMDDYKSGRYTVLKTSEDIKNYINAIN